MSLNDIMDSVCHAYVMTVLVSPTFGIMIIHCVIEVPKIRKVDVRA